MATWCASSLKPNAPCYVLGFARFIPHGHVADKPCRPEAIEPPYFLPQYNADATALVVAPVDSYA